MPLSQVDTPALILELDAFERNLDRMQSLTRAARIALRPHAKAHKTPAIALAQLQRGAVGICCQKVSEALPFVQAGVRDIHISNEIAGPAKARMLAAMAQHARLSVCVDHPAQVQWLGDAMKNARSGAKPENASRRLGVLIEIDIGQQRCGVDSPDGALGLLDALARHPSLHFQGLQAYHGGLQHIRSRTQRRDAAQRAAARTSTYVDALENAGQACPTVTGGGTGSVEFDCESGVYTEVQPGSYALMDGDYGRNETEGPWRFEQSLFIASAVMSTRQGEAGCRVVVDAGLKSIAVDSGLPRVWQPGGEPSPFDYTAANDEHGIVQVLDAARWPLELETRLLLVPSHCDPTLNLHDQIVCVRAQEAGWHVECLWPVSARGLSR
ncbi:MAG: DSD1 family PLP-dependent enzyme [Rubrivivax sp.]